MEAASSCCSLFAVLAVSEAVEEVNTSLIPMQATLASFPGGLGMRPTPDYSDKVYWMMCYVTEIDRSEILNLHRAVTRICIWGLSRSRQFNSRFQNGALIV